MTSFSLKLAAFTSMLIDHTGNTFSVVWDTYYMRMIGRIAFPIYAFLIAEGCRNTRDIRKYLLRLGAFALISEVPFDLFLFGRAFAPEYQNVFFTLFLGTAAIWAYEIVKKKLPYVLSAFVCIPFAFLAYLMKTDYGAYGVMAIFVCYVFKARWQQATALALVMLATYSGFLYAFGASLPAMALILAYNGRRGVPMKLTFYFAYPGHLLILAGMEYMIL